MNITLAVGVFFIVLATVFAVAAARDPRTAGENQVPANRARRRVAMVFAIVGLGLVLYRLASH